MTGDVADAVSIAEIGLGVSSKCGQYSQVGGEVKGRGAHTASPNLLSKLTCMQIVAIMTAQGPNQSEHLGKSPNQMPDTGSPHPPTVKVWRAIL